MATWPAGLPAPQKKISITPGDTRIERKLQSGRTEFRRFGDGKPDQMKVLFRLLWAQWDTFKEFYERDLNLSLNWFSASWLATLGYSEHKAKILGYPREVGRQGYYVDIVCALIIQKTVWIVGEDTEWPCATTGAEPPPLDEKGYIYGGYSGFYSGNYCPCCKEYDPVADTWTSKTDIPSPARYSLTASTVSNSGYIIGGYNASALQDCDQYTPDTWASKADMPSPARYELAASTIGDSIYTYGGFYGWKDCDKYVPDVNAWTCKTDAPITIYRDSAVTIGDLGYIFYGSSCLEYDPVADTWASKTDIPAPYRTYAAASAIGNSGYLYGGAGSIQDCDEYTPDTWVSKTNMPAPGRYFFAASTIGDSGYIYGGRGGTAGDRYLDCDQYTPDTWASKADIPGTAGHEIYALTASTI